MPQLNPEFYLSQLFWLVVTFSFLLIFLWKYSLPRIGTVLEKRESKINSDIQSAKKLHAEAEEIHSKIELQLHKAHNQANELIKKTTYELQNKSSEKLKKINNELKIKINESAKEIQQNKINSIEQINKQVQEITKLTLSKLTLIQITEKEINNVLDNSKDKLVY